MNNDNLDIQHDKIETTVIFNKDHTHRYSLKRVWDSSKPNISVILLNPSEADLSIFDQTTMRFMNYIIDKNMYGGIYFLNLYSYIDKFNGKIKKKIKEGNANTEESDSCINKSIHDSNSIYLGYGRDIYNDILLHEDRLLEIKSLLNKYINKKKIYKIIDKNKKFSHPSRITINEEVVIDLDDFFDEDIFKAHKAREKEYRKRRELARRKIENK